MATMRAAVVHDFGAPLSIEDHEVPVAGPRDVLIKVEACGLCAIDAKVVRGAWPSQPSLPLIPGHETVGRIAVVGSEVSHVRVGDRVVIPRIGWTCGRCEHCLSGREVRCGHRRCSGLDVDGGFAEYQRADADFVVAVPWGLDPLDAACLSCAGATAFRAVQEARVTPGDLTAVFGIGGVGHLAIQYARLAGASVVGVDQVEEKLALGHEVGAGETINAAVDDPVEVIARRGGADQAIVTAPDTRVMLDALRALRSGGTLVIEAVPDADVLVLPVFELVHRGITVIGALGANRLDVGRVLDLHAAGHTRVVHQARSLNQINEAIAELQDHKAPARLIFELR